MKVCEIVWTLCKVNELPNNFFKVNEPYIVLRMLTWLTADVVSAPCRRLTRGDLYFFFKLYFKVLTFREFIYVCTNAILVSLIGFDRCKEKPNANLVTM